MVQLRWLLFLTLFLGLQAGAADRSGGGYFDYGQKAEKKESTRWTLAEWLEQKDRNRMMDLWLGMYAPSPYEFFLAGAYQSYTTSTKDSHQSFSGSTGAYATIVGLQGEYENNDQEKYNDLSGSFHLRLLGNAVQGTHLIAFYGLRTRTLDSSGTQVLLRNQFAGGDLNLYITRYFGLCGNYKSFFPVDDATLGTVKGSRAEGGAFIDFGSLRIYGNYFSDRQESSLSGKDSTVERTGIQSGLKFFF